MILAAALTLSLAACGEPAPTEPSEAPTSAVTEAPAGTVDEAPAEDDDQLDMSAFISSFDSEAALDAQTVYDGEGVKVEAAGIEYDPISGPALLLSAENTTDKNLELQADSVIINGFMINVGFSLGVAPASSSSGSISVPYTALALAGIRRVASIELSLRIVDEDSFEIIAESESVELLTTAAEDYEPEYDESGQTVYDKDGVRIILKGVDESRLFSEGAALIVYMINDSDNAVRIQAKDVAVNGYEFASAMSATVLPSKRAVDVLTIFDMDMDEYGIESIDSVELSFKLVSEKDRKVIGNTGVISVEI